MRVRPSNMDCRTSRPTWSSKAMAYAAALLVPEPEPEPLGALVGAEVASSAARGRVPEVLCVGVPMIGRAQVNTAAASLVPPTSGGTHTHCPSKIGFVRPTGAFLVRSLNGTVTLCFRHR